MQHVANCLKASRDFSDDPVPGQGKVPSKPGARAPFRPAGGAASLSQGPAKQGSQLAQTAPPTSKLSKSSALVAKRCVATIVVPQCPSSEGPQMVISPCGSE